MNEVGRISSAVSAKGRTRFRAVKRSVCDNCGGSYGFNPNVRQCACPEGWSGTMTDLGVISDSGPTKFFARILWNLRRDLAADINALKQRFA